MRDVASLQRRRPRALIWVLLVLLLLAAAFVLVVSGRASDWGRAAPELSVWWSVALVAWEMLPFIVMGLVVVTFDRGLSGAMPAVVVGVLAVVGLTVWGMTAVLTSESSTAALGFVFIPLSLLLVVGVSTGVAAGLHVLRARRAPGSSTVR